MSIIGSVIKSSHLKIYQLFTRGNCIHVNLGSIHGKNSVSSEGNTNSPRYKLFRKFQYLNLAMQNFIHFSALNLQLCEEFHSCGKDVIDRTNTVRQYIHDSESLIPSILTFLIIHIPSFGRIPLGAYLKYAI